MSNDINAAGYELKPWWPYVRELMSNQVTVESVTILENGVYTAPAGKAYSPVVVNVAGGSSDFSTAEVTLVNSTSETVTSFNAPLAFDENALGEGAPATSFPNMISSVESGETLTLKVILYKGNGSMDLLSNSTYFDVSLSGNIESVGAGSVLVHGNGTITFTDKA